MNIVISVEDQVGERARERAVEMGKTLEDEVEEFIRGLADKPMRVGVATKRKTLREGIYSLG